jgi:glycosyltransferase involved in cell wall biosynthesis
VPRPLTIRFFTSSVHTQGTYFRFHHLARELAALGHDVTVHGSDHDPGSAPRTETRDGVTYDIVPESRPVAVFAAPCHPVSCLRRARRPPLESDVAHMFQPFPSALGPWLRARAGVKFYDWDEVWAGGLYPWPPRRPGVAWAAAIAALMERWLPRAADHTTVVGTWLGERARGYGGQAVSVVHNGFVPRGLVDKRGARAELGLDPEALYLAFTGRTPKLVEWSFEALERSAQEHPSLRLLLAGPIEGHLDKTGSAARERIDFLGDLSPDRAALCQEAADIGLLPMGDDLWNRSRFAIKYSDYLGAGMHVVCSDVGECGRLARENDAVIAAGTTLPEWLEAVELAVSRVSQLEWPRRTAPEASSALAWPAIAGELEAVYLAALDRSASPISAGTARMASSAAP